MMADQVRNFLTVERRFDTRLAAIELQHVNLPVDTDAWLPAVDEYRLDLSLTPRTPRARLSFQDRWPPHRFEALGRIYVVPPGQTVRARSDAGSQNAVICYLRETTLDGVLKDCGGRIRQHLDAAVDIRSTALRNLMAQLGGEVHAPGFASAAMCEALVTQIAVELSRYYLRIDDSAAIAGLPAWRLALIDDRLREGRTPPTLVELATLCGLSVRHLTRGFRASRGCSISAYVADHQINTAKLALIAGESVKSIAYQLGFSSRSSFSHAFRRETGMAPQQFREQQSAAARGRIH